jgi:hypothetical protein
MCRRQKTKEAGRHILQQAKGEMARLGGGLWSNLGLVGQLNRLASTNVATSPVCRNVGVNKPSTILESKTMCSYENMRRVVYEEGATFVPVCETCGRFVIADGSVQVNEITGLSPSCNATCSKCGRTHMVFEGFI